MSLYELVQLHRVQGNYFCIYVHLYIYMHNANTQAYSFISELFICIFILDKFRYMYSHIETDIGIICSLRCLVYLIFKKEFSERAE